MEHGMQKMKENLQWKKTNKNCGCRIDFVFRLFLHGADGVYYTNTLRGTINFRFKRNIYSDSFVITYLLKIFYELYGRNGWYNNNEIHITIQYLAKT